MCMCAKWVRGGREGGGGEGKMQRRGWEVRKGRQGRGGEEGEEAGKGKRQGRGR